MNELRSISRGTGKLKSKLEIRQAGSKMNRLARRNRKEVEKDRKVIRRKSRKQENRKEGRK
jgi:hypothetical protein